MGQNFMGQNFFDTNVIIYLTDQRDSTRLVSRELIKAGGIVSVQVLNETARVLRGRKFNLSWDQVDDVLNAIKATCDVVPLDARDPRAGCSICQMVYGWHIRREHYRSRRPRRLHDAVHRRHARRTGHRWAHDPQSLFHGVMFTKNRNPVGSPIDGPFVFQIVRSCNRVTLPSNVLVLRT